MNNEFMVVLMSTFQWFVCLFTNTSFQKNISRVILDHLLLDGIVVLFKAGIAIFDEL